MSKHFNNITKEGETSKPGKNSIIKTFNKDDHLHQRLSSLLNSQYVIDQIHDAVIATDLNGTIISWNKGAEHQFGYTPGEIIYQPVYKLYPEERQRFQTSDVLEFLRTKGNFEMETMKEGGCKFALDDFGSGLSSFAYLKTLHIDYLKIDGFFVKDINDDPIDYALVKSINEIGHEMSLLTIAEFVEDKNILNKLKKIGVDFAQGFYFGDIKQLQLDSKTLN